MKPRAKEQAPERRGSARELALPLAACRWAGGLLAAWSMVACGEGESVPWVGVQDCAVGIPPQAVRTGELVSSQQALAGALVTPLGSGFVIRDFTLTLGTSFSCEAEQVTARFVAAPGALARPGAADFPALARSLELLPFPCRASDGRTYTLAGDGQGDQDALFFNQTFTAWLGTERATLVCSTRFQRQVSGATAPDVTADAGLAPLFGPRTD
jgi:hypothetical protein